MEAISLEDGAAAILKDRCIGCGLCVPACPTGSVRLVKKEKESLPPRDVEALYETIMAYKQSRSPR